MDIVRSKNWPWVVNGGLVTAFVVSILLLVENGGILPAHSPFLDFLPAIAWIAATVYLTKEYGSHPQREMQHIGSYSLIGSVAFFGALVLSIMSLKADSFLLLVVAIAFFYGMWGYSFWLLYHYAKSKYISLDWAVVWNVCGFLALVIFGGEIVGNLFGSFFAALVFIVTIYLLYRHFLLGLFLNLRKQGTAAFIIYFLGAGLLSFLIWTAIFIFLIFVFLQNVVG